MKSRWVTHKGKRIFIADFSDYVDNSAGIKQESEYIVRELEKEPLNSVLAVTYVEGTFANEQIIHILLNVIPLTNAYVKARCVVGLRGFRKRLAAVFTRITGRAQFEVFETLDEAMDYLANQT